MKKAYVFLGAALALSVAVPTAHAQSPHQARTASAATSSAAKVALVNLTKAGNSVKAGDAACPDQPYYLYSGGKSDTFASPVDSAYPSPNLVAFIPPGGPTVPYDVPMSNGRFGDSFNLQNTRGVCYAVIQYRTKSTDSGSPNDGLTFGHIGPGGSPFTVVGQVINSGSVSPIQSYALDATGLKLLSQQSGYFLDKTPDDSILDLYLQDDTMIDFFRMYVWYGPNCAQMGSC